MNREWMIRLGCGLGLVLLAQTAAGCSWSQSAQDQEQPRKQATVAPSPYVVEPGVATASPERLVTFSPSPSARLEAWPTALAAASGPAGDGHSSFRYLAEADQAPGIEELLGQLAREVAGQVYYGLQARELKETPRVAVTAAVPLADLKRESEFGRVLAEYLLTDLAGRGLAVTELRLGRDIHIIPQTGEYILSRNIGELASSRQELDYVVVSTYSNTRRTLMLHGRLVELQSGRIQSSWRHSLPLNRDLIGLFDEGERSAIVNVRGMM